jgi:hypothetical protein
MFCPEEGGPETFPDTNNHGRLEIPPKLNYMRSQSLFYPEKGGERFLRNADTFVPNSTASQSQKTEVLGRFHTRHTVACD